MSFHFQEQRASNLSDKKQLKCGGEACKECGACRDWYFDYDKGGIVKRNGTKCIHGSFFGHEPISNPDDENCYPVGRLICECKDNH